MSILDKYKDNIREQRKFVLDYPAEFIFEVDRMEFIMIKDELIHPLVLLVSSNNIIPDFEEIVCNVDGDKVIFRTKVI